MAVDRGGPGSRLRRGLRRMGVLACGGCLLLAAEMDEKGPEWCLANIDDLTVRIIESWDAHPDALSRTSRHLPWPAKAWAVKYAIRRVC